MKTFLLSLQPKLLLLALGIFVFASTTNMACSPQFDQTAVDHVTNLRTQLTDLMGHATHSFASHGADIKKVTDALDKAVSHANATKGNKAIADSWNTLKDDLVVPFLARWKEKGSLDKDYVKEATAQVTKSLDAIKKAEMAKKK